MCSPAESPRISPRHLSELTELGLDYWWFAVRGRHVDAALAALRPAGGIRYLDLGCGTGTVLRHVIDTLRPADALGIDATRDALQIASERGAPVQYADLHEPFELSFAPDAITMLDVLEHLDDPGKTLRHLARASSTEAALVVTVPAMPSLYSRWDELSGHHRRYTRETLAEVLSSSGWSPVRIRYFMSYCVIPAWIERKLLDRVTEFEFPRVAPALNRLLTRVGALEWRLGSLLPFGTSLFAVARRT